ncbi:MAG: hypothetical protein ACXQS8_03045, partial [Candidatus Helarchaeales archaeon]
MMSEICYTMFRRKHLKEKVILIAFLLNLGFLGIVFLPFARATTSWGLTLPSRYDVIYNLNGLLEFDWLCVTPFPSSGDSLTVSWLASPFNPYSMLQTSWDDVFGTGSWISRQQSWVMSGVMKYNLTGNFEWPVPFNISRFNLFLIPLSGADLSISSLAGKTSVNISGTFYSVVDAGFNFLLSVELVNPLPNIHSFQENIIIDKSTGQIIRSQTVYSGKGVSGWDYTLVIDTILSPIIPLLLFLIIIGGIGALVIVLVYKKRETIKQKARSL